MSDDWRRPGHAVGEVKLTLKLPAVDVALERRHHSRRRDAAPHIKSITRFLAKELAIDAESLAGASFVISAAIRTKSLSERWMVLSRWKTGESVPAAIERARAAWAALPKEEWDEKFRQRAARHIS